MGKTPRKLILDSIIKGNLISKIRHDIKLILDKTLPLKKKVSDL